MGHNLSKHIDPVIDVIINTAVPRTVTDSKVAQKTTTIAPNYNSGEVDSSLNTLVLIPKLLEESERKLKSKDYADYLSLLERASNLGSCLAAAKLGSLYLRGLQDQPFSTNSSFIFLNYKLSSQYYFFALKLINLINYTLWDMNLLLEVIVNVTELYRNQFNRRCDVELWDNGLTILKQFDSIMNETQFVKFQTYENNQISKAIRIHILFIFALTHELDNNLDDAMKTYHDCEKIGITSISYGADKLVKKSHTNYRLLREQLDKRTPNVLPVCVQCDFEPKDTKEIWKLLVCAKCRVAACCSSQCLQLHMDNDH